MSKRRKRLIRAERRKAKRVLNVPLSDCGECVRPCEGITIAGSILDPEDVTLETCGVVCLKRRK